MLVCDAWSTRSQTAKPKVEILFFLSAIRVRLRSEDTYTGDVGCENTKVFGAPDNRRLLVYANLECKHFESWMTSVKPAGSFLTGRQSKRQCWVYQSPNRGKQKNLLRRYIE